jgi:hypothetical protein
MVFEVVSCRCDAGFGDLAGPVAMKVFGARSGGRALWPQGLPRFQKADDANATSGGNISAEKQVFENAKDCAVKLGLFIATGLKQ